ncbi:MAG: polyamine transporter ATP-binding protein [Hyphomicrobiales bacterium]|nr:polyamine transporter ATP-binding protein [Hyphomicrobiales bacterium]
MNAASALLQIEAARKSFGAVPAVDGVSLEIARGEFFALLGPSGCGKTTLMRMIAGFETLDGGRIVIDGVDVSAEPPHRRPVNMMFQSYALFPHMNVERNIAFGLHRQGMASGALAARVREMLRLVQMEAFAQRKPESLSGGQKARVALARALACRPKLLLLDEPLAALDRKLREETQFELRQVQADLGLSFLVVTHDQHEAMAMAQRMAVMRAGRIEQMGAPRTIYEAPETRWVADFIGETNLIEARVREVDAGAIMLDAAGGVHRVEAFAQAPAPGEAAAIAVRPERLIVSAAPGGPNEMQGVVHDSAFVGGVTQTRVRLSDGALLRVAQATGAAAPERGARVFVSYAPAAGRVLTR